MKIPFVNLDRLHQPIRHEIDEAISRVIDRHNFINGQEIELFEQNFADFLGVRHVIGVSSGTDALFLVMKACEINPDDIVVTVPNTFIATTEAISMAGAEIRFVDADPRTANMDPRKLESFLNNLPQSERLRVKAIIFVNLYGSPADLDTVYQLTRKHRIILISDAAQAHDAGIDGQSITDFADITTYSFFPGKNLGAFGDAGAVATNDDILASKISLLRNHGRTEKYLHQVEAYNCRLDTLQAAVLNVKLKYLNQWNENRIRAASLYDQLLAEKKYPGSHTHQKYHSVFHIYVTLVENRSGVIDRLNQAGISSGIHYPLPLHLQPAYQYLGYKKGDFPITEKLAERILSLPIDGTIKEEEIRYIAQTLPDNMDKSLV